MCIYEYAYAGGHGRKKELSDICTDEQVYKARFLRGLGAQGGFCGLCQMQQLFGSLAQAMDGAAQGGISVGEGPQTVEEPFLPQLTAAAAETEVAIALVVMHIPLGAANKVDVVHLLCTAGDGVEDRQTAPLCWTGQKGGAVFSLL